MSESSWRFGTDSMEGGLRATLLAVLVVLVSWPASRRIPAPGREVWEARAPAQACHGASRPPAPTDVRELRCFLDPFFAHHMAERHVPGAVFVLVKDDKIVFARGYGDADLARAAPVVPDRTIFRVASVSKLFTATAVMQLAEQGRVRLDVDVNRYLRRLTIPATGLRPITLDPLLTQSSGFDLPGIGNVTLSASGLRPLGTYLAQNMPPRIAAPGELYLYSNYNTALAGYLVEAVSGEPFDLYIARHILAPLAMHHSSFAQPLPTSLRPDLTVGYDGAASPHPQPFEYYSDAPAVALSATGTDMAHFMIAQLQGGRYGLGRILRTATVREMQRQHFSSYASQVGYPPLPGMAYGFERYDQNGRLFLSKDGQIGDDASLLTLLPDQRLGFFVASNTGDNGYMYDLQREFINRYYPAAPRTARPATPVGGDLISDVAGSYWDNRYSRHTLAKMGQLLQEITVTADGPRTLTIHFADGSTVPLTEVAPLLFQTVFDSTVYYWAFRRDAQGHIIRLVGGNNVYDRVAWYDTTTVQAGLIAAFALIFLSACLRWLLGSLRLPPPRGPRGPRGPFPPRPSRVWAEALARPLAGLTGALNLIFGLGLFLQQGATNAYDVPPGLIAVLCIPLLTTALAAALAMDTALVWRNGSWSRSGRVHLVVVSLAALAFIPFLVHWNLLGIHV